MKPVETDRTHSAEPGSTTRVTEAPSRHPPEAPPPDLDSVQSRAGWPGAQLSLPGELSSKRSQSPMINRETSTPLIRACRTVDLNI
jgi:hypothetical protein